MSRKKDWIVYAKKADFNKIAEKFGISPVIARILRNREICTDEEIKEYLASQNAPLYDPMLMKGMDEACKILKEKIAEGKKIRVVGDYDIDGTSAASILKIGLTSLGCAVDVRIPDRMKDGYGLNLSMVDDALTDGIDTIITCDNGIAAFKEVQKAKDAGLTVIVTDHHEVPSTLIEGKKEYKPPCADAVVDPKQEGCKYPFKELCGAGIAWKLLSAMGVKKELLDSLLQIAAFATIGDVVPLVGENRTIVRRGLDFINKGGAGRIVGLDALIEKTGLDDKEISPYHIGFVLGPCVNAAGRLESAIPVVELLTTDDKKEASEVADRLYQLNDKRKKMTEEALTYAVSDIESLGYQDDKIIVSYLTNCHQSIAGIVAGRLKDRYYKPVIIITDSESGVSVGSARSVDGFSIYEALNSCSELFEKFGGHDLAAGFSIDKKNINILRERLNKYAADFLDFVERIMIDVPMPISYVNDAVLQDLDRLEPFGKGNEKPVFADKNLLVITSKVLGNMKNFLKLEVKAGDGSIKTAVKFLTKDEQIPKPGDIISIIYYPEINEFRGISSIQFRISELRIN